MERNTILGFILLTVIFGALFAYTLITLNGISENIAALQRDISELSEVQGLIANLTGVAEALDPEWRATIAAARDEGSLVWYSATPEDTCAALVAAFEKKYGIRVDWARIRSGDLANKMEAELAIGNPSNDVGSTPLHTAGVDYVQRDLLMRFDAPNFQFIQSDTREYWVEQTGEEGYIFPQYTAITPHAYHLDYFDVSELPTKWSDFWENPAYKDLISFQDPKVHTINIYWWSIISKDYGGFGWMQELADNGAIGAGAGACAGLLVSGERPLWMGASSPRVKSAQLEGANVEMIWNFSEGLGGYQTFSYITKTAQHPNAAKVFVNFLLSREAAEIVAELRSPCWVTHVAMEEINGALPAELQPPELGPYFFPDMAYLLENEDDMMAAYDAAFGG
jgi:iron(III) transport system substrate-binding protein